MQQHSLTIAPSLLAADFACLADELARAEAAGADWHHVDVMDGHFVPNLSIGPPVVKSLARVAKKPLDVHLMIEEPGRWVRDYAEAGAHVLTFHLEACPTSVEVLSTIALIRELGVKKVGLSLNPDTPVERLGEFLSSLDLVLVMSVFPGFGGQSFMPEVLPKVHWLREQGFEGQIEMDGGLNAETLPLCAAAGADCLVAGSALYGPGDMKARLSAMRSAAERARSSAESSES